MRWRFLLRRWWLRLRQQLTGADYTNICRCCGEDTGLFTVYPDRCWYTITGTDEPVCWGCFGKRANQYATKNCGGEPAMVTLMPDCHERHGILRWIRKHEARHKKPTTTGHK